MPIRTKKTDVRLANDEIKLIENTVCDYDFFKLINQQVKSTNASHINILQQIEKGIYLLSVKRNDANDTLQVKKISDKAQYSILPAISDQEIYSKLSLTTLKNLCHSLKASEAQPLFFGKNSDLCHLNFFFQLAHIENLIAQELKQSKLFVRETLSNRTMILSDNKFNYPLILAKVPAVAIWQNKSAQEIIAGHLADIKSKFELMETLFLALQNVFNKGEWTLRSGHLVYSYDGLTKSIDYATLVDDLIFANLETRIEDFLNYFNLSDLDTCSSFPTVSVRSLVHLKARPQSLSFLKNGYAIVAATESFGKQSPVDVKDKESPRAFTHWLSRAENHLGRHNYKARVIFASDTKKSTFSLVGEQIATVALFPKLVVGIFEALNLDPPKSVKLIAHNEDVLTIGNDLSSWVDINAVNQKGTALFKLVSNDGADPLSLFEQITLPKTGVGSFHLKVVPKAFFELLETAYTMKHAMPPGHDHYLLGLAYECLNEWGLAVGEFQKALRSDTRDPDILHGLGCALMEIGQISESLPFLKRAFELMPEDPEVANNWGRSSLECGQITDAIKAFERAVRLSPGSADYLKNLGDGYLLAARPTDALETLNKAIRCNPNFADAHASLANLHFAYGDESMAKKHALLAYKENPLDTNIANLLWRLTVGKNKKS